MNRAEPGRKLAVGRLSPADMLVSALRRAGTADLTRRGWPGISGHTDCRGSHGTRIEEKMVKKKSIRKGARKSGTAAKRRTIRRKREDSFLAPLKGAERREVAGVRLEVGRAGAARVKRMVYPSGFRWSVDMKPIVGTDLCMHAHVGFLARGRIHIEYPDGCVVEHTAPQIVAIDPGHDGWVVGNEPAVLIEFDFEGDTVNRLGMPDRHRHF
jgi:hypothetical protein